MQDAWAGLHELESTLQSALLKGMLSGGAFVDMQGPLKELLGFTDWDQAAERGRIVPHAGSNAKFDAAEEQVHRMPRIPAVKSCSTSLRRQSC